MAKKEKLVEREELIGLLQLVIIFTAILAGREIGNLYSSFREVSSLSLVLGVSEEQMAGYLLDTLQNKETNITIGIYITVPGYTGEPGQILELPDYVRKWLISVTISPIIVRQPEVSDIQINFAIEDTQILDRLFKFQKEKVGYVTYLNRKLSLEIDDLTAFQNLLKESAEKYGGELKVSFVGYAKTHLLFLESQLPFSTKIYPLIKAPKLELVKKEWTSLDGTPIKEIKLGENAYVTLVLRNPMRVHFFSENVTCSLFNEKSLESEAVITKNLGVESSSQTSYIYSFKPKMAGTYEFSLESSGGVNMPRSESPKLVVVP